MPTDRGRAWDALMRRHWKGLWTPANRHEAEEARAALRAFLEAVHEDLTHHRRALDEARGPEPRVEPPPKPHVPLHAVPHVPPPKMELVPGRPALAAAVLEPRDREAIERALGHRFHNPRLLEEALAHPTFTQENPEIGLPSNYRLAFLGDALLGFLIADALHANLPEADQQILTERRKHIVNRPALGRTAERLGIAPHLLLGRQLREGRKNRTILAETFEALVAAIYLDGGPDAAKAFVDRILGGDMKAPPVAPPRVPVPGRRRSRGRGGRGRGRQRAGPIRVKP